MLYWHGISPQTLSILKRTFCRLGSLICEFHRLLPGKFIHYDGTNSFRDTEMSTEICNALRALRDKCLGPKKDRTRHSIAYERGPRYHPVRPGGRTFSFGLTHQRQRALSTPSAGGKFLGRVDSDLKLRQDVVKVSVIV